MENDLRHPTVKKCGQRSRPLKMLVVLEREVFHIPHQGLTGSHQPHFRPGVHNISSGVRSIESLCSLVACYFCVQWLSSLIKLRLNSWFWSVQSSFGWLIVGDVINRTSLHWLGEIYDLLHAKRQSILHYYFANKSSFVKLLTYVSIILFGLHYLYESSG